MRDLDDEDLKRIEPMVLSKSFKAGQVIIEASAKSAEVMVLYAGTTCVHTLTPQGKEIVYYSFEPGEIFGDWSAIDGEPRSASVTAETDCQVGIIEADTFLEIVSHYPSVALRQMQSLTAQLREINNKMSGFLGQKANMRVQLYLLNCARSTEKGLLIETLPTHADIARYTHTQREVVARELNQLIRTGVLVKAQEGIYIREPDKLEVVQFG